MRNQIIAALILLAAPAAQALYYNPYRDKNPEKEYGKYMDRLNDNDIYFTLPEGYTIVDTRGNADVRASIGFDAQGINMDCVPTDIGAIVEDDSCNVAVCFPHLPINFDGTPNESTQSILAAKGIEADLRMNYNDMHLDVRPLVKIIAEEDMSMYADADTVAIYEFEMPHRPFMEKYAYGTGIYLRKKNHPSLLLRFMFDYNSVKNKDKYIRETLDNLRFGNNPNEVYLTLEKFTEGKTDFSFPTHYRMYTGILPDINDETLEEINRVKAWCEAHGMKQLPQLDDAVLKALNNNKSFRDKSKAEADSIVNSDVPDDKKILAPYQCDTKARFPGKTAQDGKRRYWEWMKENLRYPEELKEDGYGALVDVEFVVAADGSIKDVEISKNSRNNREAFKNEALRLIKSMPRWIPATFNGKSVSSHASCFVRFTSPEKPADPLLFHPAPKAMEDDQIYEMRSVPVAPKFPGSFKGLNDWIQDHLQYPAEAAKAKIEGRVIVEFIIDNEGKITNPKVVRGVNDALNNEALRVIRSLPRWEPGYSDGVPVKTRYTFPVTFRLAKAK